MRLLLVGALALLLAACEGGGEVKTVCGVQIGTGDPVCIFVTDDVFTVGVE